jgi:hypothetical protein
VLPRIQPNDPFTIKILRIGAEAKAFKADPATFQELTAKIPPYHGSAEPGPTAHFDDPAGLIPSDPPRAKNFNYKLANFEDTTGVRIVARLFKDGPPPDQDRVPGAWMKALAEKLGVAKRGALAVYFAADDDWRVWIGDESTAAFFGRPVTAKELRDGDAFHKAKEAFLDATRAEGDAAFAKQKADSPADRQPPPAQHLKLQTDAVLDGLILKLEPRNK